MLHLLVWSFWAEKTLPPMHVNLACNYYISELSSNRIQLLESIREHSSLGV